MKRPDRLGATLVELLVVMLIVVVLAISLVPLFQDYTVKAQYAAEALPSVGDIKTRVLTFRSEHGYLPGVPRNALNDPLTNATYRAGASQLGANNNHSASTLGAGIPLQTFVQTTTDEGSRYYHPGQVIAFEHGKGSVHNVIDLSNISAAEIEQAPFHFFNDMDINPVDYSFNRLRPNHIFYRTDAAGFGQDGYLYVIGVFGNDDGLPAGTGYAVMELYNPAFGRKFTATWQRYRAARPDARQIGVISAADAAAAGLGSVTDWKRENVCWIGEIAVLMEQKNAGAHKVAFEEMLSKLRDAGWAL